MNDYLLSGERYLRAVLDAIPDPVLIVDRDLQIHDANRAAHRYLAVEHDLYLRRRCGDLVHCLHAGEGDGCGTTEFCKDCVLRQATAAVADGGTVHRRSSEMRLEHDGRTRDAWFLVTGAPLAYEGMDLVILTLEEITELNELRRIIPLCSHCRKIRDDDDFWHGVEAYFEKHTHAQFSHGICPDCYREHYPEMFGDLTGGEAAGSK